MLIYVALSGDCCGYPFEGILSTLNEAKERVERSGRPEAVEVWDIPINGTDPRPVERWEFNHTSDGPKWIESQVSDYKS